MVLISCIHIYLIAFQKIEMLTNINSNLKANHDEQKKAYECLQQHVRTLKTKINTMQSKHEEVVTSLERDVTAKEKVRLYRIVCVA